MAQSVAECSGSAARRYKSVFYAKGYEATKNGAPYGTQSHCLGEAHTHTHTHIHIHTHTHTYTHVHTYIHTLTSKSHEGLAKLNARN